MLFVLQFAMIVRALGGIFFDEESVILGVSTTISEPIVMPVRMVCEKAHLFTDSVLDIPFMIAYILIAVLRTFLP
ncbi:MAG: hypothetical protein J5922_01405 [Clostridia bacterium]|nr:hypothetical protein [Clostridia bacterium]